MAPASREASRSYCNTESPSPCTGNSPGNTPLVNARNTCLRCGSSRQMSRHGCGAHSRCRPRCSHPNQRSHSGHDNACCYRRRGSRNPASQVHRLVRRNTRRAPRQNTQGTHGPGLPRRSKTHSGSRGGHRGASTTPIRPALADPLEQARAVPQSGRSFARHTPGLAAGTPPRRVADTPGRYQSCQCCKRLGKVQHRQSSRHAADLRTIPTPIVSNLVGVGTHQRCMSAPDPAAADSEDSSASSSFSSFCVSRQ